MNTDRVAVFIDGSNFYFALKRSGLPTRVDYYQLGLALAGDRALHRVYYYNTAYDPKVNPDKAKAQQPFLDSLDRTPYVATRYGRLIPLRDGSGFQEKGVDVRLSAEMVYYAALNQFDVAVILTEDQDFAPAIQLVRELGQQVELGVFRDHQTRELVKVSDKLINLNEIMPPGSPVFPKV